MNEIEKTSNEVIDALRRTAEAMSSDGDEELVRQFVPTKHELMTLVAGYLDSSYETQFLKAGGADWCTGGEFPGNDIGASRGSGILRLLGLLCSDVELEDLIRRHLSSVHYRWSGGACPYHGTHDGGFDPDHADPGRAASAS